MKMIRMAVLVAAASAAASKAKEYARENPEKASQTIGKVEAFVSDKAGPQYADKVAKGSHALRASLGLPEATTGSGTPTASTEVAGSEPTDPPRGFDPSI